jgi:clan AA aspartic protease (TIGR02281 family)
MDRSTRQILPLGLLLAALVWGLIPVQAARCEVYGWTDSAGVLHFTDDLSRVPPSERSRAAVSSTHSDVQILATRSSHQMVSSQSRVVPFERTGRLMQVRVRINDSVEAPFVIDTGSDWVALPGSVAEQLELDRSPTRRVRVYTASGAVSLVETTLGSVEVGEGRAEQVKAVINPHLEVGLLGLSFLERFRFTIDTAQHALVLDPLTSPRSVPESD